MFGQRSRRWSNDSIIQTLGHPHCDNNYAALFVECRLCNYVYLIMQKLSNKSVNTSLKKDVDY